MNDDVADVRVLVVDDQELIRHGIATLLSLESGIEVVGKAESGEVAVELAKTLEFDIVLMDIRMPGINGIEALTIIRAKKPSCQVLMLTTFNDDDYIVQALQAGACGYLLKDTPSKDLAQAVRLAHSGVHQLSEEVSHRLVERLFQEKPAKQVSNDVGCENDNIPVTPRERHVLKLLALGASNKEIAEQLTISEATVKKHITSILQSLDLRDRTQAAIYAVRHGLA